MPTNIKEVSHLTNNLTRYKNGVLAYTFSLAVVLGVGVAMAYLQMGGVQTDSGINFWLINGAYSICLGLVALLILKLTKQPIKQSLGLTKDAFNAKKLLVLLATVFVLLNVAAVVNNWFIDLLTSWGCNLQMSSVTSEQIKANPVLAVVVACILPAINEELVFRGLLCSGLKEKLGNLPAVLLTGLLFALFNSSSMP